MEHKFYKEQGVLKCFAYSIKSSEVEKKIKNKEKFGEDFEDEEIYGEPIQMVLDFKQLGSPLFFTPNKVELYEEGNFENGVHVEFMESLDFVLLISFIEFEKLYYDYKDISNGS